MKKKQLLKTVNRHTRLLLAVLLNEVKKSDNRVADSAIAEIDALIRHGLGVLKEMDNPQNDDQLNKNILLLTSALLDEAKQHSKQKLKRSHLKRALQKICPLWPFC